MDNLFMIAQKRPIKSFYVLFMNNGPIAGHLVGISFDIEYDICAPKCTHNTYRLLYRLLHVQCSMCNVRNFHSLAN